MDDDERAAEIAAFKWGVKFDPWWIVTEHDGRLPEGLDVDTLRLLRVNVYAIIQTLDATLDDTLPVIGLLVRSTAAFAAAGRSAAS